MDFAVRPGFSEDGKRIVLVAQGGYFARVALEDIRKEFGVRVPDELLHDLASQGEVNRRTLSEIATSLFEAKQHRLVQGYLPVADISRNDLAARRNHSNPSAKGESGADVLVRRDDSQIGFQVTQYHFEGGLNPGKTRNSSRGEESRRSAVGLLTPMFINPLSMAALAHVLRAKAKKSWSKKEFPDMRLLVAASIPQGGEL
jgi:hypothetical protein